MEKNVDIFVYKVAKELGITLPTFYAVFFPNVSYLFNMYYVCLPAYFHFPTWSNDLKIYTGINKKRGIFNNDFKSHKVPWSTYKEILRRWNLLDKKKIMEANNIILTVFPKINQFTMPEQRLKLLPYVGMTLKLYAEISQIST